MGGCRWTGGCRWGLGVEGIWVWLDGEWGRLCGFALDGEGGKRDSRWWLIVVLLVLTVEENQALTVERGNGCQERPSKHPSSPDDPSENIAVSCRDPG